MIHGDVLYLRNPEGLPDDSEAAIDRLIRAALIALAYGLIDHARAIFERPQVMASLKSRFGVDPLAATSAASRHLARRNVAPLSGQVRQVLKRLLRGRS